MRVADCWGDKREGWYLIDMHTKNRPAEFDDAYAEFHSHAIEFHQLGCCPFIYQTKHSKHHIERLERMHDEIVKNHKKLKMHYGELMQRGVLRYDMNMLMFNANNILAHVQGVYTDCLMRGLLLVTSGDDDGNGNDKHDTTALRMCDTIR